MPKTPRPYQIKSLEILKQDASGLDASEMGAGKTFVATRRVQDIDTEGRIPRVLVVSPVNPIDQWIESFADEYPALRGSKYLRHVGSPKSDPESWKMILKKLPGVYIVGWETMRGLCPYSIKAMPEGDPAGAERITGALPQGWTKVDGRGASRAYGDLYGKGRALTVKAVKEAMRFGDIPPWGKSGTWDIIIADEVHRIQNRGSSNLLVLRQIKANHKLALSGTPAGNRPEGIWPVLNWLWKDQYPTFWKWAQENLVIDDQYVGAGRDPVKVPGDEIFPGAIFRGIPCLVRWRTADVVSQMPEVVERVITVPMGGKQKKIYDSFEKDAFAWVGDMPVMVDIPLEKRIRLRQAALGTLKGGTRVVRKEEYIRVWAGSCVAGSLKYSGLGEEVLDIDFLKSGDQPKIEAIKEIIDDLPSGEPVLIFAHSAKWASLCAEVLDKSHGPARAWTGNVTGSARSKLKSAFGKDVRILVAQVAALAEGVDGLQHVCRCEIWASPSDDGILNDQAKARLHRPGQKDVVQRWLLHSEKTIDDDVDFALRMNRARMGAMYGDKEYSS